MFYCTSLGEVCRWREWNHWLLKQCSNQKIEPGTDVSEEYLTKEILLKSMAIDTMPILNPKDWVKEQMGDVDIYKIVQLLVSNQLSTYKAQELDSSAVRVLLKYRKILC